MGDEAVETFEGVAAVVVNAHHDAAVLDAAVGIEEFGADCADFGAHGLFEHGFEPAGFEDGGVVVEEEQDGRLAGAGGRIVDEGEVEGLVAPVEVAEVGVAGDVFGGQLFDEVAFGIIGDDDFEIAVEGFAEEAVEIGAQDVGLAA